MSLNGAGNILIADMGANTIRQATPAGVVTTIAGTPPKREARTVPHRRHASIILQCSLPMPLEIFYVGDSNGIRE